MDGDWTYASFILRVRPNELVENYFLWRLLNHMRKFELFGKSTSQQVNFKMNASYFRDVEVIVPPVQTQQYIVKRLTEIWDIQNSLRKRIENGELMKLNVLFNLSGN